jgi:restriction endonuclease S subunit
MIDFGTYETVKLGDVAEFGRAKKDKVYPAGCSTIQISATKGQIGFLTHASTVEAKEAVIRPQAGIDARYFNIVLQKNVAQFMEKYATGLNIQEKEIANFPIQLHNVETQKAIADMMKYMDDKADTIESEIAGLKKLKKAMLEKLMV